MAKGLRSSTKKANRAKLRCKVFGPVEDARMRRLSGKLLEVASRPKTKADEDVMGKETDKMNTKWQEGQSDMKAPTLMSEKDMEINQPATSTPVRRASSSRIQNQRRGKARVSVIFPGFGKSKRLASKKLLQR